jgi:hypothetical protein
VVEQIVVHLREAVEGDVEPPTKVGASTSWDAVTWSRSCARDLPAAREARRRRARVRRTPWIQAGSARGRKCTNQLDDCSIVGPRSRGACQPSRRREIPPLGVRRFSPLIELSHGPSRAPCSALRRARLRRTDLLSRAETFRERRFPQQPTAAVAVGAPAAIATVGVPAGAATRDTHREVLAGAPVDVALRPSSPQPATQRPALDFVVTMFWIAALLSVIGGIVIGSKRGNRSMKRTICSRPKRPHTTALRSSQGYSSASWLPRCGQGSPRACGSWRKSQTTRDRCGRVSNRRRPSRRALVKSLLQAPHHLREVLERGRRFVQIAPEPPDRRPLVLRRLLLCVEVNEPQRVLQWDLREVPSYGFRHPEVAVRERALQLGVGMAGRRHERMFACVRCSRRH